MSLQRKLLPASDTDEWNSLIRTLNGGHILQSSQWAEIKSFTGWSPQRYIWQNEDNHLLAAACILRKPLPSAARTLGSCLMYAPKGPLLDWSNTTLSRTVIRDLQVIAREERAVFLKIDPDAWLATGEPGDSGERVIESGQDLISYLSSQGWHFSPEQIQFRNTIRIDLRPTEVELLAAMKQKTRYNIQLASKRGVQIRTGSEKDFPILYSLYEATGKRDHFLIRSKEYYLRTWSTLLQAGLVDILIAMVDDCPVSALFLFHFHETAWYFYGMSSGDHREKMPNHLLQWEAILRAKRLGCQWYDLWGAPDEFVPSDRLWGVYRFKIGFNGTVFRGPGAWDFIPNTIRYQVYQWLIPKYRMIIARSGSLPVSPED